MQPDLIAYVCDFVDSKRANRLLPQRLRLRRGIVVGLVDGLGQAAGQYLHHAVGIGMVVDRGAFAGVPYEQQLGIDIS